MQSKVFSEFNEAAVTAAVDSIKSGGVVIFPTETVYALACDATNLDAIQKIYKIKTRSASVPLSLLVANISRIAEYVDLDFRAKTLINHFSPGPITYVLDIENLRSISSVILKDNAIGFRIPDHEMAISILQKNSTPIVGTSVNISGNPAAVQFEDISPEILAQVDIVIRGDKNACKGVGSTVVRLKANQDPSILREGPITLQEIKRVF